MSTCPRSTVNAASQTWRPTGTTNFALPGLTQSLAQELPPNGIRVNAICPGLIDTWHMDDLGRAERWDRFTASVPMKRAARDDEVAGLVVYLCSPKIN